MQNTKDKESNLVFILFLGFVAMWAFWLMVSFTPFGRLVYLPVNIVRFVLSAISPKLPWHLTRSTATVAYFLLTGTIVWGLIVSTKIVKEITPAPLSLAMHNVLSWSAVALVAVHGLSLLFDTYFSYRLSNLLIPFTGPYKPFWVGLGTLSFFIMFLASASFNWRKRIGQKTWRMIHMLTFPMFAMATFHGLMAGTDSANPGMRIIYLGSVLLVLFLTNYRLIAGQRVKRSKSPSPKRVASG